MSATATVDAFFDAVRKSGLLSADQIDAARSRLAPESNGTFDARQFATALVLDGLLTNFQAQQLLRGRSRHFVLDEFRILEPIRSGESNSLFLAEHATSGNRVAIEVFPSKGPDIHWKVRDWTPATPTGSPTPLPNELKVEPTAIGTPLGRPRPKLMTGSPTPIPRQTEIVSAPNPPARYPSRWPLLAAIVLLIASVLIAALW